MPLTGKFDIAKFKEKCDAEFKRSLGQIEEAETGQHDINFKGIHDMFPDMPDLEYTMGEGETVESVLKELHGDDYYKLNPSEKERFNKENRSLVQSKGSLKGKKLMVPFYMLYDVVFDVKFPEYSQVRSVMREYERTHNDISDRLNKFTPHSIPHPTPSM